MWKLKISAVVASIAIATGVLGSHTTNSLWPWIPVSVGLAVLVILAGVLWQPGRELSSPGPILVFITSIAVFYRAYTFIFPASMISLDPDGYATWINQLIAAESIDAIGTAFYQDAPIFILANGIVSIISNLPVREAMIIIPIIMGLTIPLCVYLLAHYIPSSSAETGLIATVIIVVGAQGVKLSYAPAAQSLATVFLILFFVVTIRLINSPRDRQEFSIILLLLISILSLTHKMPVLIVFIFLVGLSVIFVLPRSIIQRLKINDADHTMIWLLCIFSFVILLVQWTFVTTYINSVVTKLLTLFVSASTGSATVSPTRMNPTAAVRPYSPLVGILLRNLHSLVLLITGAIVWLILAYTERDSPAVQVLLLTAGVLFIFFPLTLFIPTDLTYTRIEIFIEPIMAVLITAALVSQIDRSQSTSRQGLKRTLVGVFVFIIVAQIITVGAAPDFPNTTREYLNSEETAAKEFGYQQFNNSMAGPYYVHEEPFPERRVTSSGEIKTKRTNTYSPLNKQLYNASLLSDCPPNILHRTTDIHRFFGSWRLTWNVRYHLDSYYNRVYSSGGASHYVYEKCK